MSHKHHRSKGKMVQKMTRDGLVQENLATGEVKHISSRTAEQEFRHNRSGDNANASVQAPSASRHSVYQQDFSQRNSAEPAHYNQNLSSSVPVEQPRRSHYNQASIRAENQNNLSTAATTNEPTMPAAPAPNFQQTDSNNALPNMLSSTPDFRQTESQQEFHPLEADQPVLQTGHHQLQMDSTQQRTAAPSEQSKHQRHQTQPFFRQEDPVHSESVQQPVNSSIQQSTQDTQYNNVGTAPEPTISAAFRQAGESSSNLPSTDTLYNNEATSSEPIAPVFSQQSEGPSFRQPASDSLYYNVGNLSDSTETRNFRQSAEQQRFDFRQNDTIARASEPEPSAAFHADHVRQEFLTSYLEQHPAEQAPRHHQRQQQADFSATAIPPVNKLPESYPANQESEKSESFAYTPSPVSFEQSSFQASIPEPVQTRPALDSISYQHRESVMASYVLAAAEQHAGHSRKYHESAPHDHYQEQHSRDEFQTSHEQLHDNSHAASHGDESTKNASPSAQSVRRQHSQQNGIVHETPQSAVPEAKADTAAYAVIIPNAPHSNTDVSLQDNGIERHIRNNSTPSSKKSSTHQAFSAPSTSQSNKNEAMANSNGASQGKAPALQSQHERLHQASPAVLQSEAPNTVPSEVGNNITKNSVRQNHYAGQAKSSAVIAAAPAAQAANSQTKDNHVDLLHRQDNDNIPTQKGNLNLRPAPKAAQTESANLSPALKEKSGRLQQTSPASKETSSVSMQQRLSAQQKPIHSQQGSSISVGADAADGKATSIQKRPAPQTAALKKVASATATQEAAVTAAAVTPIVIAEETQIDKAVKTNSVEAKAIFAEKKAPESFKDNGIPITHRVEKPDVGASDSELDFSHRKSEAPPAKKKAAQEAALKNRRQKIFQEQTEATPPKASAALHSKDRKSADKPTAGEKMLTRKEQLKQKAAADSARKATDTKKSDIDSKKEPVSSSKKVQQKKAAETKAGQAPKKKSTEQGQQSAKKKSKLQFAPEDESGKPAITGTMKSGVKAAAGLAVGAAGTAIHGELHKVEQDNTAVEALHKTELLSERGIRTTKNLHSASRLHQEKVIAKKASRLKESAAESQSVFHLGELEKKQTDVKKKGLLNRFFQKQQNKRRAAEAAKAAKSGTKTTAKTAKSTASAVERTATAIKDFAVSHKKAGIALVALLLMFAFLLTQLQSCSVIASQSLGSISASSWPAEDSEITQADLYYSKLEAELQYKIDTTESRHSGCDEYNYNIGEIGHDPVVLISYLCAKYGDFTFNNEIKRELNSLFAQQYQLTEEVKNETRTVTKSVRVGESLGNVVTSGYCNCSICCGQWSGGPTASGAYPQANHTIAVDASNPFVPMGTKVVMNGVEYTVEDTGAFDQYGVQFDVYYDSHSAASAHGHQTWEAYIADGNGSQTVEVTTTENVKACYVTLTSTNLTVLVNNLLDSDQKERYDIYNSSRGNRCFLGSPFETNWRGNISSYFGYRTSPTTGEVKMHEGLDIAMPEGTQILSVQDGTVQTAGYSSSYGNYIVIQNDDGYQTLYAHCKTLKVSAGQTVAEGDVIATVGSTGNSTGNHLHIEFRYQGDLYNPYLYLNTGSGSAYGGGSAGAALTTEIQQKLFAEAEKYLGMPYVWGGSSPSTGFDCSGFVSYVFTASGIYNMGRLTAQGIYDICTPISASEAQPGDLIFFVGTYNTTGISHVGIYAGNGQMLHCGDPIQYTSIETSYWQSHFYAFGRVGN